MSDALDGVMPHGLNPTVARDVLAWVQAYVRDDARPPQEEINAFLLPSSRLTAAERLKIHREQYWIHARNALAGQLPKVEHFMGRPAFDTMLWHYVRACPLRSYSLSHWKQELPEFLLHTEDFKYRSFIRELAMLEIACQEVQWSAPQTRLTREEVLATDRPLVMIDAVRLLSFRHPVLEYFDFEGETVRAEWGNEIAPNWLLVGMNGTNVDRVHLAEDEYYTLVRLRAGERWPEAAPVLEKWAPAGLFTPTPRP